MRSEAEWKTMALESLEALRKVHDHLEDLRKSNPGYIAKLCLQDYGLWNDAMLMERQVLLNYEDVNIEAERADDRTDQTTEG